ISPGVAWFLNRPPGRPRARAAPVPADHALLRRWARRTWRYFDDFVGEETNWLPPDNYQTALQVGLAHRTSPTNIGMWLLAGLAACDLGYLSIDEFVDRMEETFAALARLERYEGHFLNWYDTANLEPLWPRYVSTVDSGNLLACLWTLAQGCRELAARPLFTPAFFAGLADTLAVMGETEPSLSSSPEARALASFLEEREKKEDFTPIRYAQEVRTAAELVRGLVARCPGEGEMAYWARKLHEMVAEEEIRLAAYCPWLARASRLEEMLPADESREELRELAMAFFDRIPSCAELAADDGPAVVLAAAIRANTGGGVAALELARAIADSHEAARELYGRLHRLAEEAERLTAGMNMRFLYDRERRLFTTGYNVSEGTMDNTHYDLLASEARLASFVALCRGDVPVEHWGALGRPYGLGEGRPVLLSWNGSLFEYLMPLLLQRAYDRSLLKYAAEAAVAVQMAYAARRGIPWGISEAAFSALDARQNYQYRGFGVPGLGLKRGLEEDLVVAPYASALALAVAPAAAVKNLKRLAGLGLYGPYGFYEAIDYTRARCPEGERGVVIYTYMAHHQGMLLLALTNALKDGVMAARFHRDPRVRAGESLLFERIPGEPSIIPATTSEGPPRLMPLLGPAVSEHLFLPNTAVPKAHLLSNGSLTVMVTNAGGGFTRWRDFDLTRWQADTTQDAWGSFLYLRDPEENAVWSAGYHPLGHAGRRYGVRFSLDRAEFRRRDMGIETRMEVVVSPEDDAEIRRVTLVNRSGRPRRIELTSYLELALAPHRADLAHPAFQKLFVVTEALPDLGVLLARRRPRGPEEQEIFAGHLLVSSVPLAGPPEYETDRARFIGRGRRLRDPVAMEGSLSGTTGYVLDPIFSLRGTVVIEPGRRVQVAFVTVAAPDRAGVLRLLEKYRELAAINAAVEMAWSNAQLDIRHLRVDPEEVHSFQELGSHILYPNPRLRPAAERLRLNTLGQARLWAHGISGDLPIVCLIVTETKELPLVQEVLLAHTYLRLRGLAADLVILNGESPGYEQPLAEELRRLILAHSFLVGQEKPGGVFLRSLAQMPEEDQNLLLTTARVVLVGARGNLAQQLAIPQETPELPERLLPSRRSTEEPTPPLPFMALEFFNGYGGFTSDGREYVVYLEKEKNHPAPWVNVLANPRFGAIVSEGGTGLVWYGNSQMNRLTPWSNDPLLDPPSVIFYLRDEETGETWTPTVRPLRTAAPYRIQHGQGYTVFVHNYRGIEAELLVFVPTDPAEPVLLQRLSLRNRGERPRRLGVFVYLDWVLGTWREETQMHVVTRWDAESGTLLARNAYHAESGEKIAFASLVPMAVSYTADRMEFIGRNRSLARPAALERVGLAKRTGAGLDPCAAEMVGVELEPGASTEVYFLLGEAEELNEYRRLVHTYRDPYRIEEAFIRTRTWWEKVLTAVQVETPDRAVDYLLNRWLLYQTLSCRLWARSSFYQSGGAIGFRDQLQDALALLYTEPRLAREQILLAAGRQFLEGDVQHWWHPESGAGTRTRCADDLVWLVYAVAEYIRHTGEEEILDLRAPFLEGRLLAEGESEAYLVPNVAMEDGTILEHCRRALRRALRRGPHGLPLIGTGDWNDGLNRVGKEGRGESVWLGWFLVYVLNSFAGVCQGRAPELAEEYRQEAEELVRALEETAWDGSWYRRAFFDDGTPLGAAENTEARIDLLPQAWAAIAGLGDPARARGAVLAAERELVYGDPPLVALFRPPFSATTLDPGYIKAYPPGVRENGGQYTHGALWLAMALARLDEPDRAYRILRLLNPIVRATTPEEAERYRPEPYVVASDVYTAPDRFGQGGWSWYTGSSGWMYRIWLEEILGFRRRGDRLEITPRLPSAWPGYRLRYRYGETWYEVKLEKPEGIAARAFTVELDGRPVLDGRVPLLDDGGMHLVVLRAVEPWGRETSAC
ncbi:MAG: DUF3131 domain-containing protein, partial [Firmicutes bacterium]|nr:DUF3131 domain-containing protein [Bacillota bacterium]